MTKPDPARAPGARGPRSEHRAGLGRLTERASHQNAMGRPETNLRAALAGARESETAAKASARRPQVRRASAACRGR